MTTASLKRLGPLYKAIGLDTNPELLSTRLASALKAFKSFDATHLSALTRSALGLARPEEMEFLAGHISSDDIGFETKGGDAELSAIAAAILWDMIEAGGRLGGLAALSVSTASFGSARALVDGELAAFASSSLATLQRQRRPSPPAATYRTKPVMKEDLQALDTHGEGNDFSAAAPHLRKLAEGGLSYTALGLNDLASQLQGVIEHQARLEEEMNIHWWLVGGWSRDSEQAFAELSIKQAALLAGKELADLTKTDIGLASAVALLDMVITKGREKAQTPEKLADLILATPLALRSAWTANLLDNMALASLLPLSLASALAVDSDDADDWKPRFNRLANIKADLKMTPLDASNQLYRELILRRQLG